MARSRPVSRVRSASWIAKKWGLNRKKKSKILNKGAWVFEWDPSAHGDQGVGPSLGVITQVFGNEIDINWGDGGNQQLKRKHVRLTPQKDVIFCDGTKEYRLLEITTNGAMVREELQRNIKPQAVVHDEQRGEAPAIGGLKKKVDGKQEEQQQKERITSKKKKPDKKKTSPPQKVSVIDGESDSSKEERSDEAAAPEVMNTRTYVLNMPACALNMPTCV